MLQAGETSNAAVSPAPATKPRKTWLAALLALLLGPLGHVYAGRPRRGFAVWGGCIAVVLAVFFLLVWRSGGALPGAKGLASVLVLELLVPFCLMFDAIRCARGHKRAYELKRCNRWYGYVLAVLAFVATAAVVTTSIRGHVVQAFRIPSGAMMPTVLPGDHILLDKITYRFHRPSRGDIIVLKPPIERNVLFLKRIVGLPGEEVEIRDKKVFINGTPLSEPYVVFADSENTGSPRDRYGPIRLGSDQYFVLGDNRDHSDDSRFWGPLQRKDIRGQVAIIYYSWDQREHRVRWDRIGKSLRRSR